MPEAAGGQDSAGRGQGSLGCVHSACFICRACILAIINHVMSLRGRADRNTFPLIVLTDVSRLYCVLLNRLWNAITPQVCEMHMEYA